MTYQSKRRFTRIQSSRRVHLQFGEIHYDDLQIKDLNLTGMFVLGSCEQRVGDTCLLNLPQTGPSPKTSMNAVAKAVRIDPNGIAIEYKSMNFDSYLNLQTTLLYEAEDPLFIGLELPESSPFEIIEAEGARPS